MFQILLPCIEDGAPARRSTISAKEDETLGSQDVTILFVEDEDLLRQAAAKMFRKRGLTVIEASDGTAALDLFRAHKDQIDLLLLDVTLPGASSREVLEEAKRLRPDLPVIVTSANSEEIAAAKFARKVERFLRKPYKLSDVVDMILEIPTS